MPIEIAANPIDLFREWFEEAKANPAIDEPTAMTLATVDADMMPSARIVLLKDVDERGFTFYTNTQSLKGNQLAHNMRAALCFYWMPLAKQVRVRGPVSFVDDAEADAYFASRPRESQIGAWASDQSKTLSGRAELEARVAEIEARYPSGEVPRPPHWTGYRVVPEIIEFWERRPHRLHDRLEYRRNETNWAHRWIYP